ncbi:MAG: hypothetical protein JZU52_00115 [Lamprocystis purpurea]|jgi:hypothetical protein|uniref:hypothetical protein n=1 Tax=Lamprocystis purpurea TaxID=61598 RepID=UPI0003782AF8|nr:hypothetical protein [Lamprocystis purpurea]MBV5272093.1 hypothetical protein [Lamprocystis purpurea]
MSGKTYALFRFTHPDGTAKDWAYAEMGNGAGLYEVRWGKEGHLVQNQVGLTRATINKREAEKLGKGYRSVGQVLIGSDGEVRPVPWRQPSSPAPQPLPKPQPKKVPIDLAALLGGFENGFYF